jgi:nucleolar complex protein 2
LDALDAFEAILDPEQNITAEGLEEEVSEDEDDEEEDSEDEYESVDEEIEDEDEQMENADDESEVVTMAMLNEWSAAASRKSPAAWKKLLLAFRSIVRSDDESEKRFTYRVESSKGILFIKY